MLLIRIYVTELYAGDAKYNIKFSFCRIDLKAV